MARNGLEYGQHAHLEQLVLLVHVHNVEFDEFAVAAAHTKIKPCPSVYMSISYCNLACSKCSILGISI